MMTLHQIAELINGTVVGDGDTRITGAAVLCQARQGDVTFAKTAKHVKQLESCEASAAIVGQDTSQVNLPCVQVDDVELGFAKLVSLLRPTVHRKPIGISDLAFVSPTAEVGKLSNIYPGAYVGQNVVIGERTTIFPGVTLLENCEVGNDVTIFPNAVLYENTKVGDRCIVHACAVLGAYGFGYTSGGHGHTLTHQFGNVELAEDVEIGAGTTIDRGTYGPTRIGKGTKIDDQVMIGHNCQIGDHNLLCSQVGIAGSCVTGQFVIMAGQVGIGDHLSIGDQVTLGAQSGVMHDLDGGQVYLGSPAVPARNQMQILASQAKLPELRKQVKRLERQVSESGQSNPPNSRHAA